MINDFYVSEFKDVCVDELRFQQDNATGFTFSDTINSLKKTFDEGITSRRKPVARPIGSCNLTRLDYFLGGLFSPSISMHLRPRQLMN